MALLFFVDLCAVARDAFGVMSQGPWNDWYHVVSHVYGSWLRGDPRGWRAVNHREHVEGDYHNPPAAGTFDRMFRLSKALMKRDPIVIGAELRAAVLAAIVEKLHSDQLQILVASVDSKHLHLLGRFADHRPREWVGRAKKHSSHLFRQGGLRTDVGGLWARRCGVKPIIDRQHQVNVFHYIDGHRQQGAVVWRFDGRGTI